MGSNLIGHLFEFGPLLVLRGLFRSASGSSLRELAQISGLSVMGTRDILRRLTKAGLVRQSQQGQRKVFHLQVESSERALLAELVERFEKQELKKRAEATELPDMLTWADTALSFYKGARKKLEAISPKGT